MNGLALVSRGLISGPGLGGTWLESRGLIGELGVPLPPIDFLVMTDVAWRRAGSRALIASRVGAQTAIARRAGARALEVLG